MCFACNDVHQRQYTLADSPACTFTYPACQHRQANLAAGEATPAIPRLICSPAQAQMPLGYSHTFNESIAQASEPAHLTP